MHKSVAIAVTQDWFFLRKKSKQRVISTQLESLLQLIFYGFNTVKRNSIFKWVKYLWDCVFVRSQFKYERAHSFTVQFSTHEFGGYRTNFNLLVYAVKDERKRPN